MAQIKLGTVSVTNGSATVTGSGTQWVTDGVQAGYGFVLQTDSAINGSGIYYQIGGSITETSLALTAPWAGDTATGALYVVIPDFIAPGYPAMLPGDLEVKPIFNRNVSKLISEKADNTQTTASGTQTVQGALDDRWISGLTTVAEMVAATDLAVGNRVRTSGYATSGDGGNNDYEIVAGGTGTDDGGLYIDLNNGLQAKGLFPDKWVRAQQFGVLSGDVSTQIKSMFAANLHFYRMDDLSISVSEDISLLSDTYVYGSNTSITTATGSSDYYAFRNKDIDQTGYTGNSNIEIVGIKFDLNGSINGGIGIAHASDIKVCGCRFLNGAGSLHFIDMPAVSNVVVELCNFDTSAATMCQIDGAETDSLPVINTPTLNVDNTVSTNIRIAFNRFVNGDNLGVHLHKEGHSDVVVTGNHFEEMAKGVGDDSGYTSGSSRVIITNNTYDCRNRTDSGQFVVFYGDNDGISVCDNVCNLGATNSAGIFLLNSDGNQANCYVTGNTVVGATSSGIVVQGINRGRVSNNSVNGYGSLAGTRYGISVSDGTAVTVTGNVVASPGAAAVAAMNVESIVAGSVVGNEITSGDVGIWLNESEDVAVLGNTFNAVGINIKQSKSGGSAENISITGNVMKDPTDHCIQLSNINYVVVSGNTARAVASGKDFLITTSASAVTAIGNNCSGNSFRYGFNMGGNGFSVISGNRIRGASDPIDTSSGTNSIVTSNMISTYTNPINNDATDVVNDNILV